jgi:hypothetical protein
MDVIITNNQSDVPEAAVDAKLHSLLVDFPPGMGVRLLRALNEPYPLPGIERLLTFGIRSLVTLEEAELCQKILDGAANTLLNVTLGMSSKCLSAYPWFHQA